MIRKTKYDLEGKSEKWNEKCRFIHWNCDIKTIGEGQYSCGRPLKLIFYVHSQIQSFGYNALALFYYHTFFEMNLIIHL